MPTVKSAAKTSRAVNIWSRSASVIAAIVLALLALAMPADAQSYTLAPTPYQTFLDNSGKIVNNGCVWTYIAGTTTPVTTYADNVGTPNLNPIRSGADGRFTAYLVPGSAYKFQYESTCTPPFTHGPILRTADNITATPASSATVDVVGLAGEGITAGQCVYLSAGDGGKSPGQWYRCDPTNAYAVIANLVGIALVNIQAAGTGTIRAAGEVTGLSSLSVGQKYYAGSLGTLTTTAPPLARLLGQADTATSLNVAANPPPGAIAPFVDDFRLSLTSVTCITSGDVTGGSAVTLYLTPCTGNRITLFDASGNVETCSTAEINIAVPATTAQMYDVWAYDSTFGSCTVTLELLAWTNDTTRATGLARTNGRWTKSGNSTRLYLGSFRTAGVSGQSEDSAVKRYVWNNYNRARRPLLKTEATSSWSYSTNAWRYGSGDSAMQVEVVVGVAETAIGLQATGAFTNTGANGEAYISIGEDVSNAPAASAINATNGSTAGGTSSKMGLTATLVKLPAIGRHFYAWIENAGGFSDTFFGTTSTTVAGLSGWSEQ